MWVAKSGDYGTFVNTNDAFIVGASTDGTDFGALSLTTSSSSLCGIRITNNTVTLTSPNSTTAGTYLTNGPTYPQTSNTNQIATVGFVNSAFNSVVSFTLPIGTVLPYAGNDNNNPTVPDGFLYCDGSSKSREGIYNPLFLVIGTTYGPGSMQGSTFNLPKMMSGNQNIGIFAAGSFNADNTGFSVNNLSPKITNWTSDATQKISVEQLPAHTHTITFPSATYVKSLNDTNNTQAKSNSSERIIGANFETFPSATNNNTYTNSQQVQLDYTPIYTAFCWIIKY
jgi:microcystin-dependent protein